MGVSRALNSRTRFLDPSGNKALYKQVFIPRIFPNFEQILITRVCLICGDSTVSWEKQTSLIFLWLIGLAIYFRVWISHLKYPQALQEISLVYWLKNRRSIIKRRGYRILIGPWGKDESMVKLRNESVFYVLKRRKLRFWGQRKVKEITRYFTV